jgi:hypothetical protein
MYSPARQARAGYTIAPDNSVSAAVAIPVGRGVATKDLPGVQPQVMPDNAQQTDIYNYFTVPGETKILISASRWILVRLTLETAGPVAVGTRATLAPVLSGKGPLLPTGVPFEFTLAPGNRLYILAESVNRVKVVNEPSVIGNPGGKL